MCRLLHRNATSWINIVDPMYSPDSHGFIGGFRSQDYILSSKAAARGCCAWLHGFSGTDPDLDAAARELLGNIWDEGFRATTLVGFPNTEALYAVLALYRIAYGPTVAASDYSLGEQCDALASSLLEHAAGRHSALDGREDDTILMHVAANLYCYVVPEDLEDDDIVESLRTILRRVAARLASCLRRCLSGRSFRPRPHPGPPPGRSCGPR